MNTALAVLAKEEDPYIDEWIDYHLKLGFSKIAVYQNDWRYNGPHLNDDRVQWLIADGKLQLCKACNHFIRNNYNTYDWAGFIDVDEFIVLKKHNNIEDFLQEYDENWAVGLNWNIIGCCGKEFDGEYSVLKRFTKCRRQLYPTIKVLVHLKLSQDSLVFSRFGPHNVVGYNRTIAVDKTHFINDYCDPHNENARDIAYLNHYYTKTHAEWDKKAAKRWHGACDVEYLLVNNWKDDFFNKYATPESMEMEDLTAYNFMFNK